MTWVNVGGAVSGGATSTGPYASHAEVEAVRIPLATGSTAARSLADRFADVVNVKDFGAVADSTTGLDGTDNQVAFQAAANAAGARPAGGVIRVPAGKYRIGCASAAGITLGQSNTALIGDGIGKTIIYYASNSNRTATVFAGSAVQIGDPTNPPASMSNYEVAGITFIDTTAGSTTSLGAVAHQKVDNVEIHHNEIVNARGTAAMSIFGSYSGSTPASRGFYVHDNWIHHSGGGSTQGDGINVGGGTIEARIVRNRIFGAGRFGLEGDFETDAEIYDNYIDMEGGGLHAIGTSAINSGKIVGNKILNLQAGYYAISFANDADTQSIRDVVVANNVIESNPAINVGFFQWAARNTTATVGPVLIAGNIVKTRQFASIASTVVPAISFVDNIVDCGGSSLAGLIAFSGSFATNGGLDVRNNRAVNNGSATPGRVWLDPVGYAGLKDARVRWSGNRADDASGSLQAATGAPFTGALAAGAVGTPYTITVTGALTSDGNNIFVATSAALPNGTVVNAYVTAADTVTVAYTNATNAGITIPAHVATAFIDRR